MGQVLDLRRLRAAARASTLATHRRRSVLVQADALEPNRDGLVPILGEEQIGLFAVAGDRAGEGLGAGAALGVEFTEVGDGLPNNLAADADRADQLPVPVDLPVLPARRVTQVQDF